VKGGKVGEWKSGRVGGWEQLLNFWRLVYVEAVGLWKNTEAGDVQLSRTPSPQPLSQKGRGAKTRVGSPSPLGRRGWGMRADFRVAHCFGV